MNLRIEKFISILIVTLSLGLVLSGCSSKSRTQTVYEKETNHQQQVSYCISACLDQYQTIKNSCQYLVSGDTNLARKHKDYARCLERKGFSLGENTCKYRCKKNTNFYLE